MVGGLRELMEYPHFPAGFGGGAEHGEPEHFSGDGLRA
jgi:hypothetical protein